MNLRKKLDQLFVPAICFIAAVNALIPSVNDSIRHQALSQALTSGFGHSFVIWLCCGLALMAFLKGKKHQANALTPIQWLFLLTVSLLLLIPSAILSWMVCIFLCLIWRSTAGENSGPPVASLMLIAIASRDPVCQSFLNLFADQILSIDAILSGSILKLFNNPAEITANTLTQIDGHSLLILTGCSAFTNLSLALLLWFCVSLYRHTHLEVVDFFRAFLIVLLILSLNSLRLAFMAIDVVWYELLHGPQSQQLIETLTIIISLTCVRRRQSNETVPHVEHSDHHSSHSPL